MTSDTAVTASERKAISEAFPLVSSIKNKDMRESVIKTWAMIWRESPYRKLADVPSTTSALGGKERLVDHVNRVGKVALGMAGAIEETFGTKVNRDILIANVILHDVDKLVMYERKGGKVEDSALEKKIAHGNYGGLVAYKAGVPLDVVVTIMSHSPFAVKVDPTSVEAVILRYGDLTEAQAGRLIAGLPPIHGI